MEHKKFNPGDRGKMKGANMGEEKAMDVHNWLLWMCYGGWIFAISMIVTLTRRLSIMADYVKHLEERLTFCCRDINKYREEVMAYKAVDHAARITFAEMQRQNEESSLSKKKRG